MKYESNENMDELLILYLKGLANEQQRAEVREWINSTHEHREYFNALKFFFQQPENQVLDKYDLKQGWERVENGYQKITTESKVSDRKETSALFLKIALPAAAALLLAFLTGIFVYKYVNNKYSANSLAYNEIIVPLGAKSQVILPDGTKVWLNAGSKLKYPVLFENKSRKVFLEGEAFFDVTPDKERMFLVKTSDITIKVFGTRFNVKSYPEENKVTTTLVEGLVAIETGDKNKSDTYLKPNQTATFFKDKSATLPESKTIISDPRNSGRSAISDLIVAKEVDPAPMTSWKDKRWVIDSEELGQLAVVFERRYNVKISFADSSLKKYTFTGSLTDETFEQVLKIIQLSAPVKFEVNHNMVTIKKEK
ncbi:MAG: FecR family protein [Bacteroidales bacterium]|nr:FecR family protein [Bacteroidales bacterium]